MTGLYLISCTEISYKEPQPKGIKSLTKVPYKLQGKYAVTEDDKPVDTLVVTPNGYFLGKDEMAYLSDSLVLKFYKGHYFVNFRDQFAWYLRVLRQDKNGDLHYLEMIGPSGSDEEIKNFIAKLSTEIKVVETVIDDKPGYVIDPTPAELLRLIKKGFFKGQTFKRLN